MTDLDDVARFVPDDEEEVVIASLVCPYCLGRPTRVMVNDLPEGAAAVCACAGCELRWSVGLDRPQALRLFMKPPRGLWIRHRFGHRGSEAG
jgi:hypothetical protein